MSYVRMTHPRLGERQVRAKVVNKMRQNGWTVADDPPKRKRRSTPNDNEPSETDSGGSSLPAHEEGNS